MDVTLVEKIVQATICLHNYLHLTENANYTPAGFLDCEDSSGNIVPGDWRSEVSSDEGGLRHLNQIGGNRYTFEAEEHEMTLSQTLTVLRGKFLGNSNMS